MENNKLKKLGKYFTKGLQAGVLATALVTGMTGCPNPSSSNGGYEIDDDKTQPKPPVTPTSDCDRNFTIPEPAEFDGVEFVADGEIWQDNKKGKEFDYHYQAAQDFMKQKVAELSQAVEGQAHIPLYQEIDDALQKMNQGNNIRDNINDNYNALATVFADFEKNKLNDYSTKEWYDYKTSYYKLAHHAYNQSLGSHKNQTSKSFPGNSEMKNDPTSFFVKQLALANYNYETLSVDEAKKCMNKTMNDIANNNNVSSDVLKKFVELALYNESLYGLNDLAKFANVSVTLCNTPREAATFNMAITDAKLQMQTRNIEDAVMTM